MSVGMRKGEGKMKEGHTLFSGSRVFPKIILCSNRACMMNRILYEIIFLYSTTVLEANPSQKEIFSCLATVVLPELGPPDKLLLITPSYLL